MPPLRTQDILDRLKKIKRRSTDLENVPKEPRVVDLGVTDNVRGQVHVQVKMHDDVAI